MAVWLSAESWAGELSPGPQSVPRPIFRQVPVEHQSSRCWIEDALSRGADMQLKETRNKTSMFTSLWADKKKEMAVLGP